MLSRNVHSTFTALMVVFMKWNITVLKIRDLCLALRQCFRDIDCTPQNEQSKHWMRMLEELTSHSKLPCRKCHVEDYDTLPYMLD